MYMISEGGGFSTGGLNFDAKVRRQSIDPEDIFHGHIGGMDVSARALLIAEKMITDGKFAQVTEDHAAQDGVALALCMGAGLAIVAAGCIHGRIHAAPDAKPDVICQDGFGYTYQYRAELGCKAEQHLVGEVGK